MLVPFARALDTARPPGDNFDLSHWYLQLPTAGGVLTGSSGSVDSISTAQLVGGFTNDYFYTGPDGAMTFWVPDNGATTSGSSHPRSELREELLPGNTGVNWTPYGINVLTASCVVSSVPSDNPKVCIAQAHEQTGASIPMVMIMFYNNTIYANIWSDGNDNNSSSSYQFGASGLGVPIAYQIAVTNGVLSITVNGTTKTLDLFHAGANWETNTVYFKAGAYSQTANTCGCSNDGARVAFYSLATYHAPCITNQPMGGSVGAGSNFTFTVGAVGNGALTYQWWFNNTHPLANATNATLTFSNVSAAAAGNYRVVVSDSTSAFMSVTSAVAGLNVSSAGTSAYFSTPGTTTWICPANVHAIQVECWGGGGAGGSALRTPNSGSVEYGGGGAGGAYARMNSYPVTPGQTYYITVGAGGVAATGTLVDNTQVPGGDSWFNSVNAEPTGLGGCLARGGPGGECAVGNSVDTRYGLGGVGSTNGSFGDILFAGGNGGEVTASTGYGGSGGGSAGIASDGISGGTNGFATMAVMGGGPGGAPNSTGGSSGDGQSPITGPGGGGGGARATTQRSGGDGADGQVVLTWSNLAATSPVFTSWNLAANRSALSLSGTGALNQAYILLKTFSLMPPVTWTPVATNKANGQGVFIFTNAPVGATGQGFFTVRTP